MRVVIVNGSAGAGKDTFVWFCREFLGETAVMELSTVTLVKSAMMVLGWDGEKTDGARKMMSDIKDAWTRWNDGSFSYIRDRVAAWGDHELKAVFVYVREPEEIAKFAGFYGSDCVTVLIRRPGAGVPKNHADMRVGEYPYDVEILNVGGLILLKNLARWFCMQHLQNGGGATDEKTAMIAS